MVGGQPGHPEQVTGGGKAVWDGPHGLPLLHHAHIPALPVLQGGLCLLL